MTSDIKTRAQILGENLKKIIKAKGITRKQLADALDTGVDSIGNYINGKTSPPLDKIFEIADFLKVSVVDLTGNNGYAPTKINIDIDNQVFNYRFKRALKMIQDYFGSPLPLVDDSGFITIFYSDEVEYKIDGDGDKIRVSKKNYFPLILRIDEFVNMTEIAERRAFYGEISFEKVFNDIIKKRELEISERIKNATVSDSELRNIKILEKIAKRRNTIT